MPEFAESETLMGLIPAEWLVWASL